MVASNQLQPRETVKKRLSWVYALYLAHKGTRCSFVVKRGVRRTMVVLRSPFHYKLPKHRIGYTFFTTTITVVCAPTLKKVMVLALRGAHSSGKPHVCRYTSQHSLSLERLLG